MRQRVRVEVRDLNPFAGNYRVVVIEKSYSDSAISNFLAGLGITVPAAQPQPKGVVAASDGAALAAASLRELPVPDRRDANCTAVANVVEQFKALRETLRDLASEDGNVRLFLETVTSERSDSGSVMAALERVEAVLQQRVDQLHHGTYLQVATAVTSKADSLWNRLDPSWACEASARMDLEAIRAQASGISSWALWRDSLQSFAEKDLPALRTAKAQASKLFVHVFEVGDYDYPTTVDIATQRQPLGPLNFAAVSSQIGEATGSGPAPQTQPVADSSWRTIANPRLSFGQRRRIGLSGALVLGIGPPTSTYGTVFRDSADTFRRIAYSRSERAWAPLLTLTARLWAFKCLDMVCAVNLHVGVAPSVTIRQAYFGGVGFAFADERIGIMVGRLSLPVQELQSGFSVGQLLNASQTTAPTQEGRVERWAVGLNFRPF
jgi:hypothetical protein